MSIHKPSPTNPIPDEAGKPKVEERRTVVIWDDELFVQPNFKENDYNNIAVQTFPCADHWFEDIAIHDPACVLLDSDMGAQHLRGWTVCCNIRIKHPLLPIFCISANPAAIIRMSMDGAIVLSKDNVPRFLKYLDEKWPQIYDSRSRKLVFDGSFTVAEFT